MEINSEATPREVLIQDQDMLKKLAAQKLTVKTLGMAYMQGLSDAINIIKASKANQQQ